MCLRSPGPTPPLVPRSRGCWHTEQQGVLSLHPLLLPPELLPSPLLQGLELPLVCLMLDLEAVAGFLLQALLCGLWAKVGARGYKAHRALVAPPWRAHQATVNAPPPAWDDSDGLATAAILYQGP